MGNINLNCLPTSNIFTEAYLENINIVRETLTVRIMHLLKEIGDERQYFSTKILSFLQGVQLGMDHTKTETGGPEPAAFL